MVPVIALEYLCVLKKTKGKLDGRVQINHPMVVCIARIVMTQKIFMKEIGICREQDNIIQTENIGDSVVYMLRTGQVNQVEHSELVPVLVVVVLLREILT